MFNQNVNQENLDVGNDDNIAEDGVLSANDIHAMPDQYFQKNDQPKGKGKWIILGSDGLTLKEKNLIKRNLMNLS